jgi:hypothetical protein
MWIPKQSQKGQKHCAKCTHKKTTVNGYAIGSKKMLKKFSRAFEPGLVKNPKTQSIFVGFWVFGFFHWVFGFLVGFWVFGFLLFF